jgi:hypothetical protein
MKLGKQWLTLRYRVLDSLLSTSDLQAPDPEELEPLRQDEIYAELNREGGGGRFLGFYSRKGLVTAAEYLGFFDTLRKRGFDPLLMVDTKDANRHALRIYDGSPEPERLLIESAVRVDDLILNIPGLGDRRWRCLVMDWLLLQCPEGSFAPGRPRFPGQSYPGLGVGYEVGEMIMLIAARLECEALVSTPRHYHNGVLYGRRLRFTEPLRQAEMLALERDLSHLTLAERSWAVELGCVWDAAGQEFRWPAAQMIFPFAEPIDRYIEGPEYQHDVRRLFTGMSFELDRTRFEAEYPKGCTRHP